MKLSDLNPVFVSSGGSGVVRERASKTDRRKLKIGGPR